MVQINFAKREVQCKVVYYGPAMSGKTANLRQIHDRSPERVRGNFTTIATDTERTLFFDFLPLNLGLMGDVRAKLNLYGIPYQDAQNSVRLLVLEGVDGIVFVADSSPGKQRANQKALENLHENLQYLGRDLRDLPLVFQWNKRDLKEAVPVPELATMLNPHGRQAFEAVAHMGAGVFRTLKAITHQVLVDVTKIIVSPRAVAEPVAEAVPEPVAALLESQVPEEPAAAEPVRIRAVASRDGTAQPASDAAAYELGPRPKDEPEPARAEPEPEPEWEPVREPEPAFAAEAPPPAGSSLEFDDVALPGGEPAPEQEPSETPAIPPWRHAAAARERPRQEPKRQAEDHLSTDSFSGARRTPPPSAQRTTDLPQRDVPRAADRRGTRPMLGRRRPTETETALVEPSGDGGSGWNDYTDPHSVDLQSPGGGGWELPASGSVRVRGPALGWDDPAARRVRDARPVVDRRRRRRDNLETISPAQLWTGSAGALALLVLIGYLVHALL
jgi:signal recognition particle receptor subunit beta